MPEEETRKNLIVISYPDGDPVTLDAERGDWTAYDYDSAAGAFIARSGNALVGLYNTRYIKSIEIKAGAKEATGNG